jgi:EpsI family protein
MTSWNTRFMIVSLLLAGTAFFLHARLAAHFSTNQPNLISVGSLPLQLGDWTGRNIPLAGEALRLLHGAKLLQRAYYEPGGTDSAVYLYVAYYANQRAGDRRHLPDDCLEGSGWSTVEAGTTTVSLPGDPPFQANRYLITRANDRELVFYWFWARGRNVASHEWADAYQIFDALRFNRSDDALIRLNTPISVGENASLAQQRLLSFVGQLAPLMHNYLPQ